jgi:hypothetical protein
MGSTMCKGGSLQTSLQLNQIYPNPKIRITYKLYKFTTIEIYKDIQWIQDIQERYTNHTLGPSMPQVAFTPLGLPSLASTHSST